MSFNTALYVIIGCFGILNAVQLVIWVKLRREHRRLTRLYKGGKKPRQVMIEDCLKNLN